MIKEKEISLQRQDCYSQPQQGKHHECWGRVFPVLDPRQLRLLLNLTRFRFVFNEASEDPSLQTIQRLDS